MNSSFVRAKSAFVYSRQRRFYIVGALAACVAIAPAPLFAAPKVSGSSQAVKIDAQNSSIKDVLSALGQKLNLQFQSSANLDKQLTGTYRGSLQRVVCRLLEGYNFIIRTNQGQLEVTVLGTQNGPAVSVPSNTTTVSTSVEGTSPAGAGAAAQTPAAVTDLPPVHKTTPLHGPGLGPTDLAPQDQSANSPVTSVQQLASIDDNQTVLELRARFRSNMGRHLS
jgi:hypothetical protein